MAMGVTPEVAQNAHKAAWKLARSNPDFGDYWRHAFEVAGVPPDEQTDERTANCERALGRALSVSFPASLRAAQRAKAAAFK